MQVVKPVDICYNDLCQSCHSACDSVTDQFDLCVICLLFGDLCCCCFFSFE